MHPAEKPRYAANLAAASQTAPAGSTAVRLRLGAIAFVFVALDLLHLAETRGTWLAALFRMPKHGALGFAVGAGLGALVVSAPWLLLGIVVRTVLLPKYLALQAGEASRPGRRTFTDILVVEGARHGIACGALALGALPGLAFGLAAGRHPLGIRLAWLLAIAGALVALLYVLPGIAFATRLVVLRRMPPSVALETNWHLVEGRRRQVLASLAVAFGVEVFGLVGVPVFFVGALVTMPLARAYRDTLVTRLFLRLAHQPRLAPEPRCPAPRAAACVATLLAIIVAARPSVASAQLVTGGAAAVVGGDAPSGSSGLRGGTSAGLQLAAPEPAEGTSEGSFLGGLSNTLIVRPATGAWELLKENAPLLVSIGPPDPSATPVTNALIDHVVSGIATSFRVVAEGAIATELAEEGAAGGNVSADDIIQATPTFNRVAESAITGVSAAIDHCTPGGTHADAYACGEAVGDGLLLGASVVPILKAPSLVGAAGKGVATAGDAARLAEAGEVASRGTTLVSPKKLEHWQFHDAWLLPKEGAGEVDLGQYAPGTCVKFVVVDEYEQPFLTGQRFSTFQKMKSLLTGQSPLGEPMRRSIGYGISDNVFPTPRDIKFEPGRFANGDRVPNLVSASGGHSQILQAMAKDPLVCPKGCYGLNVTGWDRPTAFGRWVVRAGGVTVTKDGYKWTLTSWMNVPISKPYNLFEDRVLAPNESRIFTKAIEPHLRAPGTTEVSSGGGGGRLLAPPSP